MTHDPHDKRISAAAARERDGRAKRGRAFKVTSHQCSARAIRRDAVAGVPHRRAASFDGPRNVACAVYAHDKRITTTAARERDGRAKRGRAWKGTSHQCSARAIRRDAVAVIRRRAASFDGPRNVACTVYAHDKRIMAAAARERDGRAKRGRALKVTSHQCSARAIRRDAIAEVPRRAASFDGPRNVACAVYAHDKRIIDQPLLVSVMDEPNVAVPERHQSPVLRPRHPTRCRSRCH